MAKTLIRPNQVSPGSDGQIFTTKGNEAAWSDIAVQSLLFFNQWAGGATQGNTNGAWVSANGFGAFDTGVVDKDTKVAITIEAPNLYWAGTTTYSRASFRLHETVTNLDGEEAIITVPPANAVTGTTLRNSLMYTFYWDVPAGQKRSFIVQIKTDNAAGLSLTYGGAPTVCVEAISAKKIIPTWGVNTYIDANGWKVSDFGGFKIASQSRTFTVGNLSANGTNQFNYGFSNPVGWNVNTSRFMPSYSIYNGSLSNYLITPFQSSVYSPAPSDDVSIRNLTSVAVTNVNTQATYVVYMYS